MTTLTVNIEDQGAERKVKAFLDKLGLNYSINPTNSYRWWKDESLVQELDKRSNDLKSGKDKGVSFQDIKQRVRSE